MKTHQVAERWQGRRPGRLLPAWIRNILPNSGKAEFGDILPDSDKPAFGWRTAGL
jgi:hypothetical protein